MKQAIIMLTCGAALLVAADPWKDKKPADWNEKDTARILTSSPWAKSVFADIKSGSGGRRGGGGSVGVEGNAGGRRGPGGGGGGGGMIGSGDGPIGGGQGGPEGPGSGGAVGGPKVTVRWESAGPSLDAFNKVEYSLLPKLREWAKDYYILTATGMPVVPGAGRPTRPGQPAAQAGTGDRPQFDPRQAAERLIQATALRRKGKDPIAPERVEFIRAGDVQVPIFFFPRKDAITEEDKDVTFESAAGPVSVKTKFNLKEMQYDGKLAL